MGWSARRECGCFSLVPRASTGGMSTRVRQRPRRPCQCLVPSDPSTMSSLRQPTVEERERPRTDAHGDDAKFAVAALELGKDRGDLARAGAAERVAQRDGACKPVQHTHAFGRLETVSVAAQAARDGPPSGLTRSGLRPSTLMQYAACEANASFSSKTSTSSFLRPTCSRTLGIATAGPACAHTPRSKRTTNAQQTPIKRTRSAQEAHKKRSERGPEHGASWQHERDRGPKKGTPSPPPPPPPPQRSLVFLTALSRNRSQRPCNEFNRTHRCP